METNKLRISSRALLINNSSTIISPPHNNPQIHSIQSILSSLPIPDLSLITELWSLFSETILKPSTPGLVASFSISADLSQISWRAHGPQPTLMEDVVSFFNSVGSPETEIDYLYAIGKRMSPSTLGAYVEMSVLGGLDGGWYFPNPVAMENALTACDPGEALTAWTTWALVRGITLCTLVGRDMGASPPRPTEIRVQINRGSFGERLELIQDVFRLFEFPEIPENMVRVLVGWCPPSIDLSVVFCSEGFVRVGILLHRPRDDVVQDLCTLSGANPCVIMEIKKQLSVERPEFVEIRFLGRGYGYDLTKEGWNIIFHYTF